MKCNDPSRMLRDEDHFRKSTSERREQTGKQIRLKSFLFSHKSLMHNMKLLLMYVHEKRATHKMKLMLLRCDLRGEI